jgi:hypothetical protein
MKLLIQQNKVYKTSEVKRQRSLEYYHTVKNDLGWKTKRSEREKARYVKDMLDPLKREAKRNSVRRSRYKYIYGVTYDQKAQMYEKQSMLCQMCSKFLPSFSQAFLDHNHITGKVRGLLCAKCNTALGYIENKEIIKNAKKYLKKYETFRTS